MKFLTALNHSYLYTADWYDFTGSDDDREYTSSPSGTIRFNGGDGMGDSMLIYTPEPFKDGVRLDNLRSAEGELLYPVTYQSVGVIHEVRGALPSLNVWGTNEGFRLMLVRIS